MRRHRAALVVGVFVIGITVLLLTLQHGPRATPVIRLGLIGYTNGARTLWAYVSLTNAGLVSISYGEWGSLPHHWIKAETASRPIRYSIYPVLRVGTGVVQPGSNEVFRLDLPADTVRWKYGFSVRTASIAERMAGRVIKVASQSGLYPFCRRLLQFVPHGPRPEQEFESEWLEVPNPRHNKSVQATAAARFRFLALGFFIQSFCRAQSRSAAVPDLYR